MLPPFQRKRNIYGLRLSDEERALLRSAAARLDLPLSKFVRKAALAQARYTLNQAPPGAEQ